MSFFGHSSPSLLRRSPFVLGAALLVGASVASMATGASAAPTCTSAPVLDLANPSAGALLSAGDLIVSGVARDPGATSGDGIDRVELFVGSRDAGGMEIGSGTPQSGNFVITAKVPSNISGGNDFVAYAHSALTGQETIVTVPVFLGAEPTPTPRPDHAVATPVVAASTSSTAACTPATTTTTTAPAAATSSATSPAAMTTSAAPTLSLANPGAGDVLPNGDIVISGVAPGADLVEFFLGNRDQGGTSLGTAVPGTGSFNAASGGFTTTLTIPTRTAGSTSFYVYARNSTTGQETVTNVPVYVGAAPTPTPRPSNS
jgi:hypothetical protein